MVKFLIFEFKVIQNIQLDTLKIKCNIPKLSLKKKDLHNLGIKVYGLLISRISELKNLFVKNK